MKLPRIGLTPQILAGLFIGGLIGHLWPEFGRSLQPLATLFIRLVMLILAPLIFAGVVIGIADSTEKGKLGGTAFRTFGFYAVNTAFALALGMALAWLAGPGVGVMPPGEVTESLLSAQGEPFWMRLFPTSAIDAMARNDVLQLVVLSLLFAVALGRSGEKGRPVINLLRSLLGVMFKLTGIIMLAAPLGVLGAAAAVVGKHGLSIGENLLTLVLTVWFGLAVVLLVVFPALALVFRVPLRGLIRAARDPVVISFATTTGASAYPLAFENMEKYGIPRRIASLVVFTAPFNFAGSSVYIGAAGLFLLQAFQVEVPLAKLPELFVIFYLATKAVGPVPRGSLIALAAGLTSFGVPPETVALGFGLLLGVDPIMDMPRTGVNMAGNFITAGLVSRWQGELTVKTGGATSELPAESL